MWPLRENQGKTEGLLRAFGRAQDGSVAAVTAISFTTMIGMAALAIDMGQAYNAATELGNAADAAALAGATQLDQSAGSCLRAIAAATNVNLTNEETFVSNPSGPTVFIDPTPDPIANANIRFLSELVKDANGDIIGTYITDASLCDDDAEFIEVTVDRASLAAGDDYRVNFSLAPLLGVTEAFPVGYAVAGMGSAFCGVVPMMMCEFTQPPPAPPTGTPVDVPLTYANLANPAHTEKFRGLGLYLKAGENNVQWGSGDFGFLAVGGGISGGGANVLRDALGMVGPPLLCLGLEDLETEPGNSSGARQGFNTRFDIYAGAIAGEEGNPDWQPAANTIKGMVRSGSGCGQGGGWGDPGVTYDGNAIPFPVPDPINTAMSYPMDSCAYFAGPCDGTTNDRRLGHGDWDVQSYLNVNQGGMGVGLLEADLGVGVGGKITRFDTYKWELGYYGGDIYGTSELGQLDVDEHIVNNTGQPLPPPLSTPQTAEYGGPQCYTGGVMGHALLTADRRTIKVAMVDCQSQTIQGRTRGIEAEGFIELFLVSPWVVNGGDHEMYTEIIGPANAPEKFPVVAKQIVQLYE